jgi:hypothetical protein
VLWSAEYRVAAVLQEGAMIDGHRFERLVAEALESLPEWKLLRHLGRAAARYGGLLTSAGREKIEHAAGQ